MNTKASQTAAETNAKVDKLIKKTLIRVLVPVGFLIALDLSSGDFTTKSAVVPNPAPAETEALPQLR